MPDETPSPADLISPKARIRIDAAHPANSDAGPTNPNPSSAHSAEGAASTTGEDFSTPIDVTSQIVDFTGAPSMEQALVQAAQLARHLQDRRREVDHRESQINARIAQLENDLRISRMWLHERTTELAAREAELAQHVAQQESQVRGDSAVEVQRNQARERHSQDLRQREDELLGREQLLAHAQSQLAEQETTIRSRQLQLDDQQRDLDEQWIKLRQERELFQLESAESGNDLQRERQTLAEQRRQFDEHADQQRDTWRQRSAHFDERQIALDRIREDILRLHREAIEMRLVAEQLWSQTAGRAQPEELTHGVARLRARLADEFRFAQQEIASQRSKLEVLIMKLDSQRHELGAQRDELVGWMNRRGQELTQREEELVEREQALIRDKQRSARLEREWQCERTELQRQIRQLSARGRQSSLVAA